MITQEQNQKLVKYLATHTIPKGLGSKKSACSIAAINLIISGKLTDTIPDCVSDVIGNWVISIQDDMPDEMRNSPEWKASLPLLCNTGKDHEQEYLKIILDWMWEIVIPQLQNLADANSFGKEWKAMCGQKTADAARAARAARAADAVDVARAAARAADAVDVARAAARAAAVAAYAADADAIWDLMNPIQLLTKLVNYILTK